MEEAKENPCVASCEVKKQSLIDSMYKIVDEIISEMPLKERASLSKMKKEDVEALQQIFNLYIKDKIDPEDEDYTHIMNEIWKRLQETHRLRVVK